MEGVEIKSKSLGEDSQISSVENVEGFQQCVKEILKLVGQNGNLAEFCDGMKSKLTTHVAELSHMHGVFVLTLLSIHWHSVLTSQWVNKVMEADLTQRAADFKHYMLEILEEINSAEDFNAMSDEIYQQKMLYMISAVEEQSRKHKSLVDRYTELINNKHIKKSFINSSYLQENAVEFRQGVNKVLVVIEKERFLKMNDKASNLKNRKIKKQLRELSHIYDSLVHFLNRNLVKSLQTLEKEVHRMKSEFSETVSCILAWYKEEEEEIITARNSRVEDFKRQLNEITKEITEITTKVLKNAYEIRKCQDEQESLKQLFKTIRVEIEAHSDSIPGFRQQLAAIGISQFVDPLIHAQLLRDVSSDSGLWVKKLKELEEVIDETMLEIEMLKNGDDLTNQEKMSEELDSRRVSLSNRLWAFTDLKGLEEVVKRKIMLLEKRVMHQMESLESYTSE